MSRESKEGAWQTGETRTARRRWARAACSTGQGAREAQLGTPCLMGGYGAGSNGGDVGGESHCFLQALCSLVATGGAPVAPTSRGTRTAKHAARPHATQNLSHTSAHLRRQLYVQV